MKWRTSILLKFHILIWCLKMKNQVSYPNSELSIVDLYKQSMEVFYKFLKKLQRDLNNEEKLNITGEQMNEEVFWSVCLESSDRSFMLKPRSQTNKCVINQEIWIWRCRIVIHILILFVRRSVWCESSNWTKELTNRLYTYYIEKTINYPLYRWVVLVLSLLLYMKRIYSTQGFYLISYTLGLYLLNLLLGFLSPVVYTDLWLFTCRRFTMMIQQNSQLAMLLSLSPLFVVFPSLSSGWWMSSITDGLGKKVCKQFLFASLWPSSAFLISQFSGLF